MKQEQINDINQSRSLTDYFCYPRSDFNNNCNFMAAFLREDPLIQNVTNKG